MSDDLLAKKVRWRSHRGMLELDLILIPFVEKSFNELTEKQKSDYQNLLQLEDPTLYSWLMGFEPVSEPSMIEIVSLIHQFVKN